MSIHSHILNQEEINSLMGDDGVVPSSPALAQARVRPYRLGFEAQVAHPSLPLLEAMHEQFAGLMRHTLNQCLRYNCNITPTPLQYQRYSDYLQGLMTPANLNVLHLSHLEGRALMVLDPALVFLVVDNMFGGNGQFHLRVEGREFSPTEQGIIRHLVSQLARDYSRVWQAVKPLQVTVEESEINAQFIRLAVPTQLVVSTRFQIEVGSLVSSVDLCLPLELLSPVISQLAHLPHLTTHDQEQQWQDQLRENIYLSPIELVAVFARWKTSLAKIKAMQVGDVVPIAKPHTVKIEADGVLLATGRIGVFEGRYAVEVDHTVVNKKQEQHVTLS